MTAERLQRIEVGLQPQFDDPRGVGVVARARAYLDLPVERVATRTLYKIDASLSQREAEEVRRALTDPVIEVSALGQLALPDCQWVIRVGFRPGVTDNVGRTASVFVCDLLGKPREQWKRPPAVFTETLYLLWGEGLVREQVDRLAVELLANPLIERIEVAPAEAYREAPVDLELPLAGDAREPVVETIALPQTDEALLALSRERTLALSLTEMQAIRARYGQTEVRARREGLGLPAEPTDIELEAIAQTWSEHCKHKIFGAQIDYTDETGHTERICSLFRSFIVQATREIGERVPWLVSVFHDNAGVVRVSEDLNLVFKVETHNSPSALDPYGGAITGIVGVNRDPFGTGMGAALLANTWGYCFGPPRHGEPLPEGLLHPRRVRDGVHQGVIDGGNQSGIPYARGFELFDARFIGKPLVFCGTVGVMPAEIGGRGSERKEVQPGDVVVMVGGRIGRDGIHGATFSSEALHGESPAQAVQIGDPITQKMMTEMLLEARDQGLYRTLTDNGAGGLSSSVGEMATLCGGAELDLERAPLKYAGLLPWQILLSEAQERMTLAVPPERLEALLALAQRREVEATAIGRFTDDGRFRLRYAGRVVGELELSFLHEGCPVMELEARWDPPAGVEPSEVGVAIEDENVDRLLGDIVGSLDYCAKVDTCRQYDHEVKGLSVIKPLVGVRGDVPADATVMRIRHGEDCAMLLSEAIAPRLSDLDPGAMAGYVVDLAVRRIVAGGGQLGRIAGLDNFCWPDPVQSESTPDGRQKLAGLVRCCQALYQSTCALDVPLISGKDSMKNDSLRGGVKISIPPTLLFSAIGWIDDARRAIDLTLRGPEDVIYVLGETSDELGCSALYAALGARHGRPELVGRTPPRSRPEACRTVCATLEAAVDRSLVSAAHAPHLGGIGAALATLALAADCGIEADLSALPAAEGLGVLPLLFAETPSRLLAAVSPTHVEAFEALCRERAIPWGRLGAGAPHGRLVIRGPGGGAPMVDLELERLRARYRETLHGL